MSDSRMLYIVQNLVDLWNPTMRAFHNCTTEEVADLLAELEQYTVSVQYTQVEPLEENIIDDET